jgi:putative Holliday junction resolvase
VSPRVLGLDFGERRIGVAVSDPEGTFALPLTVVQRGSLSKDIAAIVRLVEQYQAEAVVLGMPFSLSGRVGPQAQLVETFQKTLAQHLAVPILAWDERLTTTEAERSLRAAGVKGKRIRQRVDATAAAIILQSYLEHRGRASQPQRADHD